MDRAALRAGRMTMTVTFILVELPATGALQFPSLQISAVAGDRRRRPLHHLAVRRVNARRRFDRDSATCRAAPTPLSQPLMTIPHYD